MDPIERARIFVAAELSAATLVLLGGSHARGQATATSDLDIVAIDPTTTWAYRQTSLTSDGVKVEQFVYRDLQVLEEWFAKELTNRSATLFSLFADNITIVDRDTIADRVRADAAARLAAGPGALHLERHDATRYHLTDLVDDLTDIDNQGLGPA